MAAKGTPQALTRDVILGLRDREIVAVDVPEWGGVVYVRSLTAAERDRWEHGLEAERGTLGFANVRASLAALSICDQDGNRLFADGDTTLLAEKNALPLDHIFAACQRLNGLGREEIAVLMDFLGVPPAGGSSSASPATSGKRSRRSSKKSPRAS